MRRAHITNDGARFGLGQHRRAQKRATGDDFGTSSFNTLSAPEPNIVSGGTPRKAAGKKRALKGEAHPGQDGCATANPAGFLLAHNGFLCYRPSPTAYMHIGGGVFFASQRDSGVEKLLA